MRFSLNLAAACIFATAAVASVAFAQEEPAPPAVSLGEPSALVVACHYIMQAARSENIRVHSCRRASPDIVSGHDATVTVRLSTEYGVFLLRARLKRTLWTIHSFGVVE